MRRNPTASMGALHPVLFMLMVYVISFVLAFFVCITIYNSIHQAPNSIGQQVDKMEAITALK